MRKHAQACWFGSAAGPSREAWKTLNWDGFCFELLLAGRGSLASLATWSSLQPRVAGRCSTPWLADLPLTGEERSTFCVCKPSVLMGYTKQEQINITL